MPVRHMPKLLPPKPSSPEKARSTRVLALPSAGTYFAQAYYLPSKWTPAASSYIWVQGRDPGYTVEYLAPTWSNPYPRLKVTVKNVSGKDITLPYQHMYQVLVKKAGAKDYLPNVGMSLSVGTIEKGATRYVFVNLRGLARDLSGGCIPTSATLVGTRWLPRLGSGVVSRSR